MSSFSEDGVRMTDELNRMRWDEFLLFEAVRGAELRERELPDEEDDDGERPELGRGRKDVFAVRISSTSSSSSSSESETEFESSGGSRASGGRVDSAAKSPLTSSSSSSNEPSSESSSYLQNMNGIVRVQPSLMTDK